jgi:hypothetical protein
MPGLYPVAGLRESAQEQERRTNSVMVTLKSIPHRRGSQSPWLDANGLNLSDTELQLHLCKDAFVQARLLADDDGNEFHVVLGGIGHKSARILCEGFLGLWASH